MRAIALSLVCVALCVALPVSVPSAALGAHITDGQFGADEWQDVAPTFFAAVGDSGGSYLYAEHETVGSAQTLYLMYDYVNSPAVGIDPTVVDSFFDVFFQVGDEDYVVRFGTTPDGMGGFTQDPLEAYEKDHDQMSSTNPDGSLNLSDPVWSQLSSEELALARFVAAITFGSSPNSGASHVIAEFELSVNNADAGPENGIYSPDPAFWSASSFKEGLDPPISSAIFQLEPNGGVTIVPALGPGGAPVIQHQQVVAAVPEPSSFAIVAGMGLVFVATRRVARKRIVGGIR
jgi:hypothetical protein